MPGADEHGSWGDSAGVDAGVDVVRTVLAAVPEFTRPLLELARALDDDPGASVALCELAGFAAELAADIEGQRPALVRLCDVVEQLASGPDAEDLVAGAFLDALAPDELAVLLRWLGPRTKALIDELDIGPAA